MRNEKNSNFIVLFIVMVAFLLSMLLQAIGFGGKTTAAIVAGLAILIFMSAITKGSEW